MKKFLAGLILAVVVVLAWGATLPGRTIVMRRGGINASPSAVWAVLADIETHPDWKKGADKWPKLAKVAWAPGSPNGGRQSTLQETYANGDVMMESIIAWEPGRRLRTAVDFGASKLSWRLDSLKHEFVLDPSGRNGTDVTITAEYDVHGPLMKLMSRFMVRDGVETAVARALEGLKAEAESRAAAKSKTRRGEAKRPGRSRKA